MSKTASINNLCFIFQCFKDELYSVIPISCSQLKIPLCEVAVLLREMLYPFTMVASGSNSAISANVPDHRYLHV